MNLWISSYFLVAGLFLSSSALTPEECRPLIEPLPLTPSMILGRSNFLYGYTDNELYNNYLKTIESYTNNVIPSTFGPNALHSTTENKLNGTCLSLNVRVTVEDNTATVSFTNFTSRYHLLPSCDGCLLYSFTRTARNLDMMFEKMRLDIKASAGEVSIRGLYLMARGTSVTYCDLEHFRKQAHCLGFTGEPDFIYDPKNGFCAEGEGRKMHE